MTCQGARRRRKERCSHGMQLVPGSPGPDRRAFAHVQGTRSKSSNRHRFHNTPHLQFIRHGVTMARRAGWKAANVINTLRWINSWLRCDRSRAPPEQASRREALEGNFWLEAVVSSLSSTAYGGFTHEFAPEPHLTRLGVIAGRPLLPQPLWRLPPPPKNGQSPIPFPAAHRSE